MQALEVLQGLCRTRLGESKLARLDNGRGKETVVGLPYQPTSLLPVKECQ
jgi:hypothetical protein